MTVIKMGDYANDATYTTPSQILEDALQESVSGSWSNRDKLLILSLDDDGKYHVNWM